MAIPFIMERSRVKRLAQAADIVRLETRSRAVSCKLFPDAAWRRVRVDDALASSFRGKRSVSTLTIKDGGGVETEEVARDLDS